MKPVVDGLEKQYSKTIEFRRLNANDPATVELGQKLNVQYVPTFVFVGSSGVIAKQLVGEVTAEQLRAQLDALK